MHLSLPQKLSQFASVMLVSTLVLGTLAPMPASAASSWGPALLVNTEAFQTIDAGDGTTNIELQFGSSSTTLKFLYTKQKFQFNKPLSVLGTISGSSLNVDQNATVGGTLTVTGAITAVGSATVRGTLSGQTLRVTGNADVNGILSVTGAIHADGNLSINDDADTNDAILTFGNSTGNQSLKFLNTRQKFQFSNGLSILGTLSGSSLTVDHNANIGGALTVTGALTGQSSITAKGALSGSTLTVDGNMTLHGITYSAPASQGGANTFLKNDGAGNLTWGASSVGNGSGGIISLHPEFPNAIYFSSGANLVGQLTASGSAALNDNFYHWTSTRATLQDYWMSVRVRLPDNFSSWDPVKPVELRYRTADGAAANNYIKVLMKDTNNAYIPTLSGSMLSPTFRTANLRGPETSGTFAAKGYITLYLKLAALTGGFADIGFLNLNFETTTP